MNLHVAAILMKAPAGSGRTPGKAKPKAKGTARVSKPRNLAGYVRRAVAMPL